MAGGRYSAVYDFGLFPYALGDVLTWNVRTAIRCEELGRERVDTYICLDERYPVGIHQKDLITVDNYELFFSELFGAFGTHPKPGNIYLYRRREEMLERLAEISRSDTAILEDLSDYERALKAREDESAVLFEYFAKYIRSHRQINAFAATHGRIPLLRPSMGCEPDVMGLLTKRFSGKRIVTFHMRLRRLDAGYGASNTYWRDSDFLEWYEFLKEAHKTHPDVQFVTVGRLQEKPLELLRLPNVISLRTLGLGLGHELSFILQSDLFIGTSSGFAAMAYFSKVPYFITKMNHTACEAYQIEQGTERMPFASENQKLVYEPETRELLTRLLEQGLQGVTPRAGPPGPAAPGIIDVRSWEWESSQWLVPGATTSRFFTDDQYSDKETAFLAWPVVRQAKAAWREGLKDLAWMKLSRLEAAFPRLCEKFPEFLRLRAKLAAERNEQEILSGSIANLKKLTVQGKGFAGFPIMLVRRWHWSYQLRMRTWNQFKRVWMFKHRIPGKLVSVVMRLVHRANRRMSRQGAE
jgi:hypothetical protein